MTPEEITKYNAMVKSWSGFVTRKLSASAAGFVHGKGGTVTRGTKSGKQRTEKQLSKSITNRVYLYYGQADHVGFNFERHGVFVHKGVGRGHPISGGMVLTSTNYEPGKVSKDRKPAEWFNPVLNEALPRLADKIAEMNADAAVNATKMYIK